MDLTNKRINFSVLFDTVNIEIHCGDDYEAQVAFDDIADTLKANGSVTLSVTNAKIVQEQRS